MKEENLCWENIKKSLHFLEGEQISAHVAVSFLFHKEHIQGFSELSTESKEISLNPVGMKNKKFSCS